MKCHHPFSCLSFEFFLKDFMLSITQLEKEIPESTELKFQTAGRKKGCFIIMQITQTHLSVLGPTFTVLKWVKNHKNMA